MFCSILESVILMPVIDMIWKLISIVYLISWVSRIVIKYSDHLGSSSRRPNESLNNRIHFNVTIHFVFKRVPIKNDLIIMNWVLSVFMLDCCRIFVLVFMIQNWSFSFVNVIIKVSQWNFFFKDFILSCCVVISYPGNIFKNTHSLWKFCLQETKWKFRFYKSIEHIRTWLNRKWFIVVQIRPVVPSWNKAFKFLYHLIPFSFLVRMSLLWYFIPSIKLWSHSLKIRGSFLKQKNWIRLVWI